MREVYIAILNSPQTQFKTQVSFQFYKHIDNSGK